MCTVKALNNQCGAIHNTLIKIFVNHNKVVAMFFRDASIKEVMDLQVDWCKLLFEAVPILARSVSGMKELFNQQSCCISLK